MLSSVRFLSCLAVLGCALAFAAAPFASARAQVPAASVETYEDRANTSTAQGVMPSGVVWNRPLKAGDMVLPRATKAQGGAQAATPVAKEGGVGTALKAPKLGTKTSAVAPQIKTDTNSTASLMLLQGMKTALQKSGQNPDIPKSDIAVLDKNSVPESAPTPSVPDSPEAKAVPLEKADGFVAGQEPKGWISPDKGATLTKADDGMMEIAFPPEMASAPQTPSSEGAVIADDSPKATDMEAAPVPLEQADLAKGVEKEKSLFDRVSEPFMSIFGEPVEASKQGDVAKSKEEGKALKEEASPPSGAACEPSVTKWTRSCADAGYPSHFVGKIVGETRVLCPSGDLQDVWLSNDCAAGADTFSAVPSSEASAPARTTSHAEVEAPVAVIEAPEDAGVVDASCGAANGLASEGKPAADLCAKGRAGPVSGNGPWRWSCSGLGGGVTVSCAAPVAMARADDGKAGPLKTASESSSTLEDGACGSAAALGVESAPTTNLCAKGSPSRVSGAGPWTWACGGSNGGQAVSCLAPRKAEGVCGRASGMGADAMPMQDLCQEGYASAVTGQGPWHWTCSGLHGGGAAMCSAPLKANAVCGGAATRGQREMPKGDLCNVGVAGTVEGSGPWTWVCAGKDGGASVSCKAPLLTDGLCGAAHGSLFEKAPEEGLCAAGTATRVSGSGPFSWFCSGENGGTTASCAAALATPEALASFVACGEAAEALALGKPTDKLCARGAPSSVKGDGPWSWTCADDVGHEVSCSTLRPMAGACGPAEGKSSAQEPSADLCESGVAGPVRMKEKTSWSWTCQGTMGEKDVVCSAPLTIESAAKDHATPVLAPKSAQTACGLAAEQNLSEKPERDSLCVEGKAGPLREEGAAWTWTCEGKGKVKVKTNCRAYRTVVGVCGGASGAAFKEAPTEGLCASGTPTPVGGSGPWMWSCVGSGNGGSASCSASPLSQVKVDGLCGAASGLVAEQAPSRDLCDSGMPSAVYGENPWTWSCSGMNGGVASACATAKPQESAAPRMAERVNGLCGAANGVMMPSAPSSDELCAAGVPTSLSGDGPWSWGCLGANGGMTVSCTAPLTPPDPVVGACGDANGVNALTAPKSGLCAAGIASAVSGKGPWTWSCSGTHGGGAVSCVAPLAGKGAQSLPSIVTSSSAKGRDEAPTPKAAPVGLVTPQLSSKTLPPHKPGALSERKVFKPAGKSGDSSPEGVVSAPEAAPRLPDDVQPLMPPPVRDAARPPEGLKPPVIDSEGKVVPGTRLILEADVSTISFESGAETLDAEAVALVEKLIKILKVYGDARITLVAYSGTDGAITPREARRISLNRALAIRDFMTTKGISSGRVDVRPMGANVPSGDMDRVDVKVN